MDLTLIFPAAPTETRFPTTRSQGRVRRRELEDRLSAASRDTLVIDFGSVNAMTISYADEFLAKFVASFDAGASDIAIVLQDLNTENLEAVQVALERRNVAAVMADVDGKLTLVGDQRQRETYDAARGLGSFRANDLASLLKISPQNANNRLKPLVEFGALRRARVTGASRGGKEFTYSTLDGPSRSAAAASA